MVGIAVNNRSIRRVIRVQHFPVRVYIHTNIRTHTHIQHTTRIHIPRTAHTHTHTRAHTHKHAHTQSLLADLISGVAPGPSEPSVSLWCSSHATRVSRMVSQPPLGAQMSIHTAISWNLASELFLRAHCLQTAHGEQGGP